MQIKRYEALSINGAMTKIRTDLGPDAIVLSTRRLKGKEGPLIEVIAARDDICNSIPGLGIEKDKNRKSDDIFAFFETEIDQLKALIMDIRKEKAIRSELTELKETLNAFFDLIGGRKDMNISPHLSKVYYQLISSGVSRKRAFQLVEELKGNCSPEDLKNYRSTLRMAENMIKQSITPSYKNVGKKKIAAFVGPTGSGKTTTLAKLAAHYLFGDKLNVGIVTMDTYRIGAAEQLKIYADIMDVPMKVASKKEEFNEILNRFADRDIILVDTPGKSRSDENYLLKLKEFFTPSLPIETNLVLSITTNQENMMDATARFGITNYDNIIFTKLDEANNFGSIYNVIDHVGKPVFYITNGQNVPRDLAEMDPEKLARLIIGGQVCS